MVSSNNSDFYYLKELNNSNDMDVSSLVEKCENEIKTRIAEELKKMRQFEPSEKLEFQRVTVREINLEELKIDNSVMDCHYRMLFNPEKLKPKNEEIKKSPQENKGPEKKSFQPAVTSLHKDKEIILESINSSGISQMYDEKTMTATNFRHNLRNLKSQINKKAEFLMV